MWQIKQDGDMMKTWRRIRLGDFCITNANSYSPREEWKFVNYLDTSNPMFNYGEFATIKSHAGLNNFKISVKEFVERTNAISLQARAGRYGGTYAHKDIAFEFAMWISPEFKIYIVKEFLCIQNKRNLNYGRQTKRVFGPSCISDFPNTPVCLI